MIGYKVVDLQDGVLYSSSINRTDRGVRTYAVGQTTVPREGYGPLYVFRDLESAQGYWEHLRDFDGIRIYRCEYEPSGYDKGWVLVGDCRLYDSGMAEYEWWSGIDYADSVTLLEEVNKGESHDYRE